MVQVSHVYSRAIIWTVSTEGSLACSLCTGKPYLPGLSSSIMCICAAVCSQQLLNFCLV